jgi:1-phosphofructokinase family hexose kinase
MSTIFTITLNPALDISGTVEELIPNEKSYVENEVHTPGGNGINAAIIAHRLKASVIATGFLGGSNGEEIASLLDKEGLKHKFLPINGRTRMNLTVSNCKTHKQTRLSFPGPKIKKIELKSLESFLTKLKGKDLSLIGGSLPPGVSTQFVSLLVKRLSKKGVRCLVDMPGKSLKEIISSKPYFIKPNLMEFQELTGKKVEKIASILPLVRKLNIEVPLICVSSVEGGAILVNKNEAWFGKLPNVKIRSSVGAGDSMVGAIAAQLARDPNTPLDILLRHGLAASCATLTEEGMFLGSRKSIENYRSKILISEIR